MSKDNIKADILYKLEMNDLASIASLAIQSRKVLSRLVRLAYDKDTLVGWRAIKAVGLAARALVKSDREFLRDTCRKLLWSLTDESGGIGWSAPEMLGEIVSSDPDYFRDIIPLIAQAYDVEEDVFRPGVVYALGRIAAVSPQSVVQCQKIIISSLVDPNPLTRAYGLGLIAQLWKTAKEQACWTTEYCDRLKAVIASMTKDRAETWVYGDKQFDSIVLGSYADSILTKLT